MLSDNVKKFMEIIIDLSKELEKYFKANYQFFEELHSGSLPSKKTADKNSESIKKLKRNWTRTTRICLLLLPLNTTSSRQKVFHDLNLPLSKYWILSILSRFKHLSLFDAMPILVCKIQNGVESRSNVRYLHACTRNSINLQFRWDV